MEKDVESMLGEMSRLMQGFDPTRMTEEMARVMTAFDPAGMMDRVTKMMDLSSVPGVDMAAVLASQKKNMEAIGEANRLALSGMQAVTTRQAQMLQEAMGETARAAGALASGGVSPGAATGQVELVKAAFERSLTNMRELAEMVARTNEEVTRTINERIADAVDELGDMGNGTKDQP